MQYPIIDLITDAYINNGWTGLEVSYSKNLFPQNMVYSSMLQPDGSFSGTASSVTAIKFYLPNDLIGKELTFSAYMKIHSGTSPTNIRVSGYINGSVMNGNNINSTTYERSSFTFTPTSTNDYLRTLYSSGGSSILDFKDVQLELGDTATNYVPYEIFTDFSNRLKLPIPYYFPHSVINALQRAAAGTQTADDTEILQHYLTPLGIGGI